MTGIRTMKRNNPARVALFTLLLLTALPLARAEASPANREEIRSALKRGGEARRKAVWYIYQARENDLLREAVPYLLKTDDVRDQKAILNVMKAYGYDLETHLPHWYVYLDHFISREVEEEPLEQCMDLALFFKEHRLMPALSRLARHPRSTIRRTAFRTMSAMGDDTFLPVLLGLISSNRSVDRMYGLEGAAHLEDYRLYPFIRKALYDAEKSVRIYAVRAFSAQKGLHSQSSALARLFSDESDPEVRESVIEALSVPGMTAQFPTFRQGVVDSSPVVRLATLEAARRLNERRLAPTISLQLEKEEVPAIKRAAVETLLYLGESGGPRGLSHILLHEPDATIRLKAVMAIHRSRERGALEALVHVMKYDPSEEVRLEAVYGAGQLGNASTLEELSWVLKQSGDSYDVRSAALTSYLALGSSRQSQELVALLPHFSDTLLKKQVEHLLPSVE